MKIYQHIIFSFVFVLLISYLLLNLKLPNYAGILQIFAFSLVGGILPDFFEPGRWPKKGEGYKRHRHFFHSCVFLFLLVAFAYGIFSSGLASDYKKSFFYFILGYISHLLADFTTPESLPILY